MTRDPELRVTPKGTPICQFSLAINREFKMESGEKREEVLYVDIEAWGKQGETIAKYVTKGKPLYVEGRLRLDQWEDKNTHEKRSRMKVVLEQFQFLASGQRDGAPSTDSTNKQSPASANVAANRPAIQSPKPEATENLDYDVPF